jgi:CRISPR system Cascade subunit CasB
MSRREVIDRFVKHLESLRERQDRAALARLRRGLGKEPGTVAEMHAVVLSRLPASLSLREENWFYLVASLFAAHPERGGEGNLGRSFARLAAKRDSASIEKRFVALLDAHEDDLASHLRHAVSLLASDTVAVDWRQLLADLLRWDHPNRIVQRSWARGFWATAPTAERVQTEPSKQGVGHVR